LISPQYSLDSWAIREYANHDDSGNGNVAKQKHFNDEKNVAVTLRAVGFSCANCSQDMWLCTCVIILHTFVDVVQGKTNNRERPNSAYTSESEPQRPITLSDSSDNDIQIE